MAPQNVSTQPTAAPAMQMSIQPSIEDAQSQKQGLRGKFEAMRLRGGGAGKDCFLGAIGCFLCCECFEGCCDCIADIVCCPCEMCC
ncbi:hypothetical protein FS749_015128 [Ceratobasidium sp. UAMH 11750]|nr:hypothetical protein FS749_015128 [Ceratobasidium sp. UAMH 11750]